MTQWIGVAIVVSTLLGQPAQSRLYQADVEVSARSGGNAWVGFVKDQDRVYEFLLEPDDQQLTGWELRLFRDDHRSENLLAAIENWHGAQRFLFSAGDFTNGPDKSLYGRTRRITVRGTKATVLIRVLSVELESPAAFRSIRLHLEFWH